MLWLKCSKISSIFEFVWHSSSSQLIVDDNWKHKFRHFIKRTWTSTRTTDIIKTNYALTKQQKKVSGTEKVVFVFIWNWMQFSRRELFDIDFHFIFCSSYALTMNATGREDFFFPLLEEQFFSFFFSPDLLFYVFFFRFVRSVSWTCA